MNNNTTLVYAEIIEKLKSCWLTTHHVMIGEKKGVSLENDAAPGLTNLVAGAQRHRPG